MIFLNYRPQRTGLRSIDREDVRSTNIKYIAIIIEFNQSIYDSELNDTNENEDQTREIREES